MLMANSGLGWLCIKFFILIVSLFYFRLKKEPYIVVKEIEIFDQNLNSVWEDAKQYSSFIAVRNCEYLKTLYSDNRVIKLKFPNLPGWSWMTGVGGGFFIAIVICVLYATGIFCGETVYYEKKREDIGRC